MSVFCTATRCQPTPLLINSSVNSVTDSVTG